MDFNLLQESKKYVTQEMVPSFLERQLRIWTHKISEAIEETNVLETLVDMIRIDGRSLAKIFGQKKIEQFLAVAKLLNTIESKKHLFSVLKDLISILCLMGCIVKNFMHLQWDLVADDCVKLYGSIKATYSENEQFYKRLFDALKSLVPTKEILQVASSICSWINKSVQSLAAYFTANWSTLMTTTGYIAVSFAVLGAVFAIFFASKTKDKKKK